MSDLHLLFNPRSIAVVGASDKPDSIGARTVANLVDHSQFEGDLWFVSGSRRELRGRPCYPSVAALPATPDVAMVVVPASAAIEVLQQCAERGVKFAVVLSSGFGEAGEDGRRLEAQMKAIAERSTLRIYGPNCPGVCNVNARLGMTFSPSFPHDLKPGPIGIATQGGGLGRNIMQAMDRGIGVALWSSSGNEVDLQVADFVDYMADAPDVRVIVTLIEGIKDGARFVAAVQKAARHGKPVVALKVGRSAYGQRAAASHTASITGAAEVNATALRQLGVIEVDDIDELVDTAWLLARQVPDGREDIAIYCSSGGAAALTADIVGQHGVGLADFAPETTAVLAETLPGYAAIGNPVDTTTAVLSNRELVDRTLLAVCRDPGVALVLLPVTIDYGDVTVRMADSVVRVQRESPVPILPIWMTDRIGSAFPIYGDAGIVPARSVGKAVKAVRRWIDHGRWRRLAHPADWRPWPTLGRPRPEGGRTLALNEAQAKAWLAEAGIAVPAHRTADSAEAAVAAAEALGYPVVLKLLSAAVTHKTELGGVRLNLADAAAVTGAWHGIRASLAERAPGVAFEGVLVERMAPPGGVETFVGVSRDPVFGHVMTFGLGGVYVEVFQDVARRLLPLQREEAEAMLREVRSFPLLDGARGRPKADVAALVELLLAVSRFVGAHADRIDELDLNPVWVSPAGALALDAVIVGRAA